MKPSTSQHFLEPLSVNIFITNLCNRRCPFCCLYDWITNDEKTAHHMSLKDLSKVIRWLKRSKINKVKIAGGEPMLHPNVFDFVKELLKNEITVEGILTNGLGETDLYKKILDISGTNWLVNIMNPDTCTNKEWKLLNRNLELLRWKNENRSVKHYGFDNSIISKVCYAITFYKLDQDYAYIIELAKKYKCSIIRYDVSRPSSDKSNVYIDFDNLLKIKPTMMEFVRRCVHEEIKPIVDDALPFCIFTQEELRFINLFARARSGICIPHLDVMPDLKVEYCTSMRGILPSYEIQDMTVGQMSREMFSDSNKYREYQLPRCSHCHYNTRELCQGYCLRFKTNFVKQEEKPKTKRRSRFPWFKLLK